MIRLSRRRRCVWLFASAITLFLGVDFLLSVSLWRQQESQIQQRACDDFPHDATFLPDHMGCYKGATTASSAQQQQKQQQQLIEKRQPTHHACDGFKGILHIAMGDIGGAAGTVFFQFVIGQMLYAERYHLKPWIHFNNVSYIVYDERVHGQGPGVTLRTTGERQVEDIRRERGHMKDRVPGEPSIVVHDDIRDQHFPGTGVWGHYFEPINDFVPGDKSCEKLPYVTLTLKQITPGIHGFAPWAPRCWSWTTGQSKLFPRKSMSRITHSPF
eukprot:scaffold456_cov171-Amphora_coffeaeformis.AAC.18